MINHLKKHPETNEGTNSATRTTKISDHFSIGNKTEVKQWNKNSQQWKEAVDLLVVWSCKNSRPASIVEDKGLIDFVKKNLSSNDNALCTNYNE